MEQKEVLRMKGETSPTRLSRGVRCSKRYFSTYTPTKLPRKQHFITKQNKYSIMHQAGANCRQNSNESHNIHNPAAKKTGPETEDKDICTVESQNGYLLLQSHA